MKTRLTNFAVIAILTAAISCSSTKQTNMANIEKKVFILVPEEPTPPDDLPAERIAIKIDDRTLYANWVNAGDTAPAFFLLHGNGEYIGEWRPLQAYLLQKGYSSFVFDYTGFGSSTGVPTVSKLNEDGLAAYAKFVELSPKASSRIAFGHSLGTSILMEDVNQFKPLPDKVVTHGMFTTAREILVEKGAMKADEKTSIPNAWNGYKNVKKCKAPLFILHSKTDHVIPFEMGQELAEAAGSNTKFLALENASHNDVYKLPNDSIWQPILNFIDEK